MLRHGTQDIQTFDEIFCSAAYRPPEVVDRALGDLNHPLRVLDLGANVGLFVAFALGRWPGAEITAVEPDPENLRVLRSVARLNDAAAITIVDAAASSANGSMSFVGGLTAESHRAHSSERDGVFEVRAEDVVSRIVNADLVKIDIEGGEWELLEDPRLASGAHQAIVMEHHTRHCPSASPRETATALLTSAGYEVRPQGDAVRGVGMIWAWRHRLPQAS